MNLAKLQTVGLELAILPLEAQRSNAGLAIKRARVRIHFATVLKLGHLRSLH